MQKVCYNIIVTGKIFLTGSVNLIGSALTSEVFLRRKAWLIM